MTAAVGGGYKGVGYNMMADAEADARVWGGSID